MGIDILPEDMGMINAYQKLILRRLYTHRMRGKETLAYDELKKLLQTIPRLDDKLFSECLDDLEKQGFIKRVPRLGQPPSQEINLEIKITVSGITAISSQSSADYRSQSQLPTPNFSAGRDIVLGGNIDNSQTKTTKNVVTEESKPESKLSKYAKIATIAMLFLALLAFFGIPTIKDILNPIIVPPIDTNKLPEVPNLPSIGGWNAFVFEQIHILRSQGPTGHIAFFRGYSKGIYVITGYLEEGFNPLSLGSRLTTSQNKIEWVTTKEDDTIVGDYETFQITVPENSSPNLKIGQISSSNTTENGKTTIKKEIEIDANDINASSANISLEMHIGKIKTCDIAYATYSISNEKYTYTIESPLDQGKTKIVISCILQDENASVLGKITSVNITSPKIYGLSKILAIYNGKPTDIKTESKVNYFLDWEINSK